MGIIQESLANELQKKAEMARKMEEEAQRANIAEAQVENEEPSPEIIEDMGDANLSGSVADAQKDVAEAPKKRGGRPKRSKK